MGIYKFTKILWVIKHATNHWPIHKWTSANPPCVTLKATYINLECICIAFFPPSWWLPYDDPIHEWKSIFTKILWVIKHAVNYGLISKCVPASLCNYYAYSMCVCLCLPVCLSPMRFWEWKVIWPHFFYQHKGLYLVSCTNYLTNSLIQFKVVNAPFTFLCGCNVWCMKPCSPLAIQQAPHVEVLAKVL